MTTEMEVLEAISKFVYWLASRHVDDNVTLMSYDEIVSELFEEIAKGLDRYRGKPIDELLAILRKMCDNRIAELHYKHQVTHRKFASAAFTVNIELLDEDEINISTDLDRGIRSRWIAGLVSGSSEENLFSTLRVTETRKRLSLQAKRVFDAVILGVNGNMSVQVLLSGMRAANSYKTGGKVKVLPFHVAEALVMPLREVENAFEEIKAVYAIVRKEFS